MNAPLDKFLLEEVALLKSGIESTLTMSEKLYLMIRIIETDAQYFREYETYVKAMVYGDSVTVPTFAEAVASLKAISSKIVGFSPI